MFDITKDGLPRIQEADGLELAIKLLEISDQIQESEEILTQTLAEYEADMDTDGNHQVKKLLQDHSAGYLLALDKSRSDFIQLAGVSLYRLLQEKSGIYYHGEGVSRGEDPKYCRSGLPLVTEDTVFNFLECAEDKGMSIHMANIEFADRNKGVLILINELSQKAPNTLEKVGLPGVLCSVYGVLRAQAQIYNLEDEA